MKNLEKITDAEKRAMLDSMLIDIDKMKNDIKRRKKNFFLFSLFIMFLGNIFVIGMVFYKDIQLIVYILNIFAVGFISYSTARLIGKMDNLVERLQLNEDEIKEMKVVLKI